MLIIKSDLLFGIKYNIPSIAMLNPTASTLTVSSALPNSFDNVSLSYLYSAAYLVIEACIPNTVTCENTIYQEYD